jgi:serine/threonine protein kinase
VTFRQTNVLMDDSYKAKLCDFGLVRLIQAEGSSTGMTTTSAHTETARYLAYELVESNQMPTTTSDIYALGCLGLEVRTSPSPRFTN